MSLQVWLSEVDSRMSDPGPRQSGGCGLNSQGTTPGSSSLKQLDNRSPASRERYGYYSSHFFGVSNKKICKNHFFRFFSLSVLMAATPRTKMQSFTLSHAVQSLMKNLMRKSLCPVLVPASLFTSFKVV